MCIPELKNDHEVLEWLQGRLHPACTRAIITLTPVLASKFLANPGKNRKISKSHVLALGYSLQRGAWVINPCASIVFGEDVLMYHGQQRCLAVVQTKINMRTYADRNVPSEALKVIDQDVRSRSPADTEIIEGNDHAKNDRAVIGNMLMQWAGTTIKPGPKLYQDAIDVLGRDNLNAVCGHSHIRLHRPLMAALVYARPIDPEKIDQLIATILSGAHTTQIEATIINLNRERQKGADRGVLRRRFMRGVAAYLAGESLTKLQDSDAGYHWLYSRRKEMGLPPALAVRSNATAALYN
jgi:hypothetical protein